jgi:hypothetical protein
VILLLGKWPILEGLLDHAARGLVLWREIPRDKAAIKCEDYVKIKRRLIAGHTRPFSFKKQSFAMCSLKSYDALTVFAGVTRAL